MSYGRRLWLLPLLCALAPVSIAVAKAALPSITLTIGSESIRAEVAATPLSRRQGLMQREKLAANQGMLFVFPRHRREKPCFWMHNTQIPLELAFLDAAGVIVQVARMEPFSERMHCARNRVFMALELPQGWLEEHGLGVGARVEGLSAAPPAYR